METHPSKKQRKAYRRRMVKDEVGESFARTSQERLVRWSRRRYNPGYMRAALLFGFFSFFGLGLFFLEGWGIGSSYEWDLLDAALFVVGVLLVFWLRDVPLPLGASEQEREGRLLRRGRARMIAVGVLGAFLLAILIDSFLLGPRLVVVATLFMWGGAAASALLLAFTNRIRYCSTCDLYGNFVRERRGWVCTTCGTVPVTRA